METRYGGDPDSGGKDYVHPWGQIIIRQILSAWKTQEGICDYYCFFCIAINWENLETLILWGSICIKPKSMSCQLVKAFLLPPASTTLVSASLNLSELFSTPLQICCKFCNVFVVVVAMCIANRTFDTAVCSRVHNIKSLDSWVTPSEQR